METGTDHKIIVCVCVGGSGNGGREEKNTYEAIHK